MICLFQTEARNQAIAHASHKPRALCKLPRGAHQSASWQASKRVVVVQQRACSDKPDDSRPPASRMSPTCCCCCCWRPLRATCLVRGGILASLRTSLGRRSRTNSTATAAAAPTRCCRATRSRPTTLQVVVRLRKSQCVALPRRRRRRQRCRNKAGRPAGGKAETDRRQLGARQASLASERASARARKRLPTKRLQHVTNANERATFAQNISKFAICKCRARNREIRRSKSAFWRASLLSY